MMRTGLTIAALALLAACAHAPQEAGAGRCDAKPAQRLLGRYASQEVAAEALKLSGAGDLRWVLPDQILTMEYKAGRLNLEIDRRKIILAIRCG